MDSDIGADGALGAMYMSSVGPLFWFNKRSLSDDTQTVLYCNTLRININL